jgi:hypothetical protein
VMVSPSAVKFTFAVAVAAAVGVKRTVTAWGVDGLPETVWLAGGLGVEDAT